MPREPWYESDNPGRVTRGFAWRAGVWIVAIVVFAGVLTAGIWAVRVATSDVRGRGDAAAKVNAADNRLFAQGNFHDLYNSIKAYDQQLDQAEADKLAHPDDQVWATNYTGLVDICIRTRAEYNAAARKISQAKFRDEDLPAQIDESDPKTDCKPTPKESPK